MEYLGLLLDKDSKKGKSTAFLANGCKGRPDINPQMTLLDFALMARKGA